MIKKIINKLFEWLGYVPKVEYQKLKEDAEDALLMKKRMLSYVSSLRFCSLVDYFFEQRGNNCYVVFARDKTTDVAIPVKYFITSDTNTDYAKLCAEELCEMLNEKI